MTTTTISSPPTKRRRRPPVRRLRIAHVTANFADGSGGITLREALALDQRYSSTSLAPEDGSLFDRAEEAGLEVIRLRKMGRGRRVYPWADVEALRELSEHLRAGEFDLVHTHAGRAGAVRRVAAHRLGGARNRPYLHGFPFNEFQSPVVRRSLRTIERRLGSFRLAACRVSSTGKPGKAWVGRLATSCASR